MMRVFRRRPEAVAVVALALLPVVLLGSALLPGRVLSPADNLLAQYPWKVLAPEIVPKNPLMTDVVALFHPWALYTGREIREGRFPLWNPHVFTGAPFFANPNTAVLFPLNALGHALPAATAVTLTSILKLSVAGVAMYWCLRVLAIAPLAALVGALAFMLNGQILVWLQWSVSSTMVVLPLLLGITERLRQGGGARWVAALAMAVASLVFGGYLQGAIVAVLIAAAWATAGLSRSVARARFGVSFAVGLALGVLLAAVQILPTVEYLRASSLFAYREAWVPSLQLSPRSAIALLLPFYYGSPMGRDFWGDFNFNEITLGVGVIPWLALPLAILVGWRRPGTKLFIALAAISAALLYGFPGGAALLDLPGIASVSLLHVAPTVLLFSLTILCGIGLDTVASGQAGASSRGRWTVRLSVLPLVAFPLLWVSRDYATLARRQLMLPIPLQYLAFVLLVTVAACLLLRWLRGGERAWRWGLALGVVELLSVAPLALTYNPVIDARWFYPSTPAIEQLRQAAAGDHSRVALGSNVAMLYGLSDPAGFDGLTPRHVERLVGPIGLPGEGGLPGSLGIFGNEPLALATVLRSPSFDLLGVRYVVGPPTMVDVPPQFSLAYEGADARIYRNENAMPRAFLVSDAHCVDDRETLRRLWTRDIDVRREVLLADCDRVPPAGPRGTVSHAGIRAHTPGRVTIETKTDAPAYLVLTDTWFPGWRVWVDGAEARLWRADHAFRAVWLPAGARTVEFRYQPASVRVGFILSGLAAVAIALLVVARPRATGVAAGLLTLAVSAGLVEARLPSPPFELDVSPSGLRAGGEVTIRIDAVPDASGAHAESYDLYLVRGLTPRAMYLTPEGEWALAAIPYRRAVSASRFSAVTRTLRPPMPGWMSVALVVVDSGNHPLARADWRYRPVVRRIRVEPEPAPDDPDRGRRIAVVGGLAFVALAACLIVLADPAGRSAR
jgi:Bacterial membrane protein YfhO